jgi:hypothetical protein
MAPLAAQAAIAAWSSSVWAGRRVGGGMREHDCPARTGWHHEMRPRPLTATELVDRLAVPEPADQLATPLGRVIVVDLDATEGYRRSCVDAAGGAADTAGGDGAAAAMATLPAVVVGTSKRRDPPPRLPGAALVDLVVPPGGPELDAVLATVDANPHASTALALVLRGGGVRSLADGLQLESAVYGTLQAGPEFARWRASRPVKTSRPAEEGPAVLVDRSGDALDVVLNRPSVRNALDARMRDDLVAALAIAAHDPSIAQVHLHGAGPAFCAGGDLDEFGTRPDPATAHLVRMTRSPARALAGLAERVVAHLHGACMGSGIELPAFAARIVGRPDTVIALPEVRLGLIPGAGGTVSLPRRIGRHRTAQLALTGHHIDAPTAHAWGLIDQIEAP